jgi:hypothetical protein
MVRKWSTGPISLSYTTPRTTQGLDVLNARVLFEELVVAYPTSCSIWRAYCEKELSPAGGADEAHIKVRRPTPTSTLTMQPSLSV